ncbi:hypothetical protein JI664_14655 [Rhodobacter sp. NTK016B]|uniref:hypothetical protein n=1 Tax=Rhodobacter sp. NTK016B TaxID=2759676 RepID=UPI001A8F0C1D|nr:hypothetical protein [Rhodobacter sp. NTK016B]MBN8293213.1 hypothetical protein [Rhodobacter sp. NTK016B]
MKTPLALLLIASLSVAGCGGLRDSRMNPRNWFGSSSEEAARPELGETSNVADFRPLVPQVTGLTIERTSSGAIIRADAVMPSAGWWDPQLVAENFGRPQGGVLTFRFVAAAPRTPVAAPSAAARTISAVYAMTQAQLDTTVEVVVVGETNSRRARR